MLIHGILCTMTSLGYSNNNSLGLQDFNKGVPPGWAVDLPNYPFTTYLARLKLWYHVTDVDDEAMGPLIASRLQGELFALANSIIVDRQDMQTGAFLRYAGDEALALAAIRADPMMGTLAQPGGVQVLMNILRADNEQHDQDRSAEKLDAFLSTFAEETFPCNSTSSSHVHCSQQRLKASASTLTTLVVLIFF